MCEISYDFRKVISRACVFFTFSDWSELEICVDYYRDFDIQYIFSLRADRMCEISYKSSQGMTIWFICVRNFLQLLTIKMILQYKVVFISIYPS